MHRRQYLGSAAALSTALAGCLGEVLESTSGPRTVASPETTEPVSLDQTPGASWGQRGRDARNSR
ncbi:MAG: hypothetical protein ABEJ42_01610 [Halobacteriaceae archaeon]